MNSEFNIILAGNPNVGKSTIFNSLTGLKQHTGNWSGKTVDLAAGIYRYNNYLYKIYDLPGTYSLIADSTEEDIANNLILSNEAHLIVVIADATCLIRGINILLSVMKKNANVALCVNLVDEAKKKGISIDFDLLENLLNVPVIGITARKKADIVTFKNFIYENTQKPELEKKQIISADNFEPTIQKAKEISKLCVTKAACKAENSNAIDKILTSKKYGIPIMLFFLCIILWLTVSGANYPSTILMTFFTWLNPYIYDLFTFLHFPSVLVEILTNGVYHTTAWVTAVMLPPMMIFFPLFTLLEDLGYLPRLAFNLDRCFKCAGSCGKQALTMCMGLGCNAVGVTGCRIISSRRERFAAMITNCFIPCNGRFSMLITLSAIFIGGSFFGAAQSFIAAFFILCLILIGVFTTLLVTKVLTKFFPEDNSVHFILELPPFRHPQIVKTITHSLVDRTLKILGRAIRISAPAGAIIWIMANIYIDGSNILAICADFLNPFAQIMGLDGIILLAFILALPANEIVLPIIIMGYLSTGQMTDELSLSSLTELLISNGWSIVTAINVMLFSLLHFPCGTTLWTIKKESNSLLWAFLGFLIPTTVAVLTCTIVNFISFLVNNLLFFS